MRDARCTILPLLLATIVATASAQTMPGPPIRPLGPIVAKSALDFAGVFEVRPLSDGRVLVDDDARRLVWMLDVSLNNPRVVIDSTPGRPNSYPRIEGMEGVGGLFHGLGDTSLFLDLHAQALLALDPQGNIARVMSLPPAPAAPGRAGGPATLQRLSEFIPSRPPAMSSRFGLVFRGESRAAPTSPLTTSADSIFVTVEDSAAVVAMNAMTHAIDTVARFGLGTATSYSFVSGRMGRSRAVPRLFPFADQWAVMADGSIAILRSRDYAMSWINTDGTRTNSPRLPYPWQHLSDTDKARMTDSSNAAAKQSYERALARRTADSAAGGGQLVGSQFRYRIPVTAPTYKDANALPDYLPPTMPGDRVMFADGDNNVWIHVRLPGLSESTDVYDIVNRKGELIDRVRLPEGRTLIDFGPGGIVYLVSHDGGQSFIEKARVK